MLEFTLFGVFMVGLLGGGHCAGMCGGIVGAVSMSLPGARPRLPFLLAYNGGRILSYTLAGVLAGALGASSFFLGHILPIQKILYGLSSVMLVLLGLYLAGVWHGVTYVERLGSVLWRQLQPLSRRLLPVRSPWQAILLIAGQMPVSKNLPYQWYDTPNVHLCTIKDFDEFCINHHIEVMERLVLTEQEPINMMPNLRGSLAMYHLKPAE